LLFPAALQQENARSNVCESQISCCNMAHYCLPWHSPVLTSRSSPVLQLCTVFPNSRHGTPGLSAHCCALGLGPVQDTLPAEDSTAPRSALRAAMAPGGSSISGTLLPGRPLNLLHLPDSSSSS
uniref:Uncharacterized protein n=1 Tax=Coturnix japonica TaxID=93934 RepID=A0A8C2SVC5_COTJA